MKKLIITAVSASFLLLTACKSEAKSVEWYKAHPDELKTEYQKCVKKYAAKPMDDENCQNVSIAYRQVQASASSSKPVPKYSY
ncbi:EexN family lipoprotein [Pantoea ananatis]|uniref:EexN family lipoprotein n=1 Tax=Pantoea ananas TaxID=553 RepID=UPI001FF0CB4C|nr:EexN family lipoprotein [Pantoea ananatis]